MIFFHGSASGSGLADFIALYDFRHQLRILHDDTASCGLSNLVAHISKILRVGIELGHVAGVGIEEIGRHLDSWTEFDGTRG